MSLSLQLDDLSHAELIHPLFASLPPPRYQQLEDIFNQFFALDLAQRPSLHNLFPWLRARAHWIDEIYQNDPLLPSLFHVVHLIAPAPLPGGGPVSLILRVLECLPNDPPKNVNPLEGGPARGTALEVQTTAFPLRFGSPRSCLWLRGESGLLPGCRFISLNISPSRTPSRHASSTRTRRVISVSTSPNRVDRRFARSSWLVVGSRVRSLAGSSHAALIIDSQCSSHPARRTAWSSKKCC